LEDGLGKEILQNMHAHTAGIKYGKKGEQQHLNLKESDLNYPALMEAFKDYQLKGVVVCESPNLEEDALLLKSTYENL